MGLLDLLLPILCSILRLLLRLLQWLLRRLLLRWQCLGNIRWIRVPVWTGLRIRCELPLLFDGIPRGAGLNPLLLLGILLAGASRCRLRLCLRSLARHGV